MEKAMPLSIRRLKIFSILFAVLVGCAVIGGTTCALALEIQRNIANSRGPVNSTDRARWMKAARTKVYDACYNGCDASPSCASEACAKTAALNITGVICDANGGKAGERLPNPCRFAARESLLSAPSTAVNEVRKWDWKDIYAIEKEGIATTKGIKGDGTAYS
ncbi:hypothetical protein VE00_04770 [Pseudogymnoascus sp. WSF 3629]|nr:hypothetical protein VE00_04770 [Pseudogymnoascus sp. WSF 3629]